MGDVIKDFYFALEDKWYAVLDFLDRHGLPVYKIIDPIDTKIPSFALFAGLVIIGLLAAFGGVFSGFFFGGDVSVTFQVVDEESSPLPNVPISFSYLDNQDDVLTTDSLGRIELTVPNGTKIDYEVDLDKYEIVKKSVSAKENTLEVIQLISLQNQNLNKTIKLVNGVGQPVLKEAALTFTCATAYGTPPNPITGSGGTFVVTPNSNCIPLSVNVNVEGYEPVQSHPLTAEKDVFNIIMIQRTIRDATVLVTVLDEQGNGVGGMDISLQVNGIEAEHGLTSATGTASIAVAAGEYEVVATDNANGVYSTDHDTVFVASGETATVTLHVNRNAVSQMNVLVLDKLNNQPLKDAVVKLKQGNTVLHTQTTNAEGKATLTVSDKTLTYQVSASKDGYIPHQQTTPGSTTTLSFVLERATGQNSAKLRVHIIDQDGEPVPDAKVVLYNADTDFLAPFEPVLSDSNGIATFTSVTSGNYQAFAYKASLTGFSNEQFFDISDISTHDITMKLEIPDGTVNVHVVDKDGNPVPFAKVSIYNAFKNKLLGADLTDTNGSYTLPRDQQKSKADKDVYLIISKTGYATTTTIQKPILPSTVQNFEVVLQPTQPGGNIKIELIGLFSQDGKIVTGVGKNRDYTARFRITIPEEHDDLDELVVHARTGEKDIVEKDEWYLTQVKFPRAIIVKGSAWDPNNGLNVDGESITFGNAKWMNALVNGPNPGVYDFEIGLHVRDTAAPQDILKVFYKAFAQNDEVLRDPADANPVDELYAATKSSTYQVGVTTICDNEFCFDSSILDVNDKRIEDVVEQYNAFVFKDYKLAFNILNNGKSFHTNSNLRIKSSNESIEFGNYEIFTADNLPLKGTVNDNEFKTPLNMGNFTPQKKIGGTVFFKPKTAGSSVITIELVSDFKSVFSKSIQINTTGNKNMKVSITPDFYPSNIPFEIQVHAEDETSGDEIDKGLVGIKNNIGILLASTLTDPAGNAKLVLPGQSPGKKVLLSVEKPEYNPFVQELQISEKIVSIVPETLGVNINVKTQAEKTSTFTITNESSLPIVVRKLGIQGNLKGFLDKEKTNSSLQPFVGVTIAPKSQLQVNMKSVLTPEGKALSEHQDFESVVGIQIENYGAQWSFEVPVKYSLGVSSEVDDPTCFVAVPHTWKTSTEGQNVTFEFQIQNNCSIQGNPSALKKLAARANWSGNELGELVLSVFEQNNPTAIGAAKVRSGFFSSILTDLPPQDVLIARLDFTPFGGVKGEGQFEVIVQAENPLEGKPQLLTSKINGQIAVVNLSDCVAYDKEILDLLPGKKDSVVIETKGCGAPVEFTLQTELEASTKEFTLQGTDKKQVEFGDNQLDQGQYPIYVKVEGNEQKLKSLQKTLRARIRDPNACLQLNRYELDVFDDPANPNDGFDTGRLDNLCVNQKVQVKVVIEKSFMDSLKKGLGAGLVAFLGVRASNLLQDKSFFGKDKTQDKPKNETGEFDKALADAKKSESGDLEKNKTAIESAEKLLKELKNNSKSFTDNELQEFLNSAENALTHAKAEQKNLQNALSQSNDTKAKEAQAKFNGRMDIFREFAEKAKEQMNEPEKNGTLNNTNTAEPSGTFDGISVEPWFNFGANTYKLSVSSSLLVKNFEYSAAGQIWRIQFKEKPARDDALNKLKAVEAQVLSADSDASGTGYFLNIHGSLEGEVSGVRQFSVKTVSAGNPPPDQPTGPSPSQPPATGPQLGDEIAVFSTETAVLLTIPTAKLQGDPIKDEGVLNIIFKDESDAVLADALVQDEAQRKEKTILTNAEETSTPSGLFYILVAGGASYQTQESITLITIPFEVPASTSPASKGSPAHTGLVVVLQSGGQKKDSQGQGIVQSVGGTILRGFADKILGTNNPWKAFGIVTAAVTLFDYFMSKDKEFSAEVLGKDVRIDDLKMIAGEKGADETKADTDIKIEKSGIALNPKINLEKSVVGRIESENLTFRNISKFEDQSIFRNLLVIGKRFEYAKDQKYKNDIPDENKLKANKTTDFKTRFHMQFNSFSPESLANLAVPPIALSCDTFSEKTGKTGKNASPKVAFEWNFNDIKENACDVGNVDSQGNPLHIYCDATQFSIELIQKVQLLRSFIEANAPFVCPSQDKESGTKTQPIPAADIGIASISVEKIAANDINVIVGIQNNTPVVNHAQLKLEYKLKNSTTQPTAVTKNVNVPTGGSFVSIGFVISNLTGGEYEAKAILVPEKCENCFNSVPASDTITTEFFIGTGSGLVECEPFTTKRLEEFIAATENAGKSIQYPNGLSKEKVLKLVHFNSHLMQDRFSPDFFTDFDRYASKISFFNAPTYYLDPNTGLKRFFTNRGKWIVNREGSPVNPEGYLLPGPGIYDVTIDIQFDTQDWTFFQNAQPDALIHIFVEKTSTTEDTSPFYSLPFNGLIGTDDGQGRVGYGVNFEGEKVTVNENAAERVTTTDITNSTPVANVSTSKIEAYTILNSLERGNILTLTKSGSNQLQLKWSPSFATPVLLKVTSNSAKSNVYGYYSVGVNEDTSQSYIGAKGNPWYGVGANCRDFQDKALLDVYTPLFDRSGVNADCALIGPQENIAYGFEWCENTIHTGIVPLKSIFYTPQGSLSTITRTAWKDDMGFIGETISGGSIPLNGTKAIPSNSPGDELGSVEKVLELVKQEAVCVRNSGAKTEFFWNPKEVLNALEQQEKDAEAQCIIK